MADIPLRGLQRIQFEVVFLNFLFDVGGEIAGPFRPFDGRFTIGFAVNTCCVFHRTVTPPAGLHDGIASPTVIGAAVLLHEDTFSSNLNGLTNYGDLPPFIMDTCL